MFSTQMKIYGAKNTQVVIVLAGWKTRQSHLWLLGQLLASYNFKAIVFTWDDDILTPDPKLTLERFIEVKEKIVATIGALPKAQQKNTSLFGMSQGTIITAMVARDVTVDKVILNLSGSNAAKIIWSWDKVVKDFKKQMLNKKITLPKLEKLWSTLSPLENLKQSRVKKVLFYMATHDELIPYRLQEELLWGLRESKRDVEALINERHPHLISASVNLLRFPIYINFLKRSTARYSRKSH